MSMFILMSFSRLCLDRILIKSWSISTAQGAAGEPAAAERGEAFLSRTPCSEEMRDRLRHGHDLVRETGESCAGSSSSSSLAFPSVFTTALEDPGTRPRPGHGDGPRVRPARPQVGPGVSATSPGGEPPARQPSPARSGSRGHSPATRSATNLRRPRRRPLRAPHASSSCQRRATGGGAPLPREGGRRQLQAPRRLGRAAVPAGRAGGRPRAGVPLTERRWREPRECTAESARLRECEAVPVARPHSRLGYRVSARSSAPAPAAAGAAAKIVGEWRC